MTSREARLATLAFVLGSALAAAPAASASRAAERVPRPEFDSGYRLPATTAPNAHSSTRQAVDLALLGAALVLASELVVRRRSRRGLVVLGAVCLAYFGFFREGCPCPIGALQNVAQAAADHSRALPPLTAAVFALPLGFALWRGRVFCAGACPAGALQDLVLLRPLAVPKGLAATLSLGRHLYLALAVLLAATGGASVICSWDPFVALFRRSGSLAGVGLGLMFVGLATVVARPYCRFLCPYGVLLGWCARLSARRARTCPVECIDCRLCEGACPVGALHPPADGRPKETVAAGVRRLALVLALAPLVVAAFGWLGSRLEVVLARRHPTVRLAAQVLLEEGDGASGRTLETRTFRAGSASTNELAATAFAIRSRFRRGGAFLGVYLGLVLTLALVRASRWERRSGHGPDAGECLACGRCFDACPQSRLARASVRGTSMVGDRSPEAARA